MTDPVSTSRDRVRAYAQIDGVQDIFGGVYFMLFGGNFLSATLVRQPGPVHLALSWLPLATILVLLVLRTRLVEAARRRFTYPRLGYVSLESASEEDRRSRIALSVAFMIVLVVVPIVAFAFIDVHSIRGDWLRWTPALAGLVLGGVYMVEGARNTYLRRYLICGPLVVALGLALSFADLPFLLVSGWGFLGAGVIMIGGGVYALWRLVRTTSVDLHAA